MASTTSTRPMGDIPAALLGLLQAQMNWGQQLFTDWTGLSTSTLPTTNTLTSAFQTAFPQIKAAAPACYVPPPCWMPKKLGDCISYTSNCATATATVRIVVTNCDRVSRTIQVRTEGAEGVTVSPQTATLNPMNRATFIVTMTVPQGTDAGKQFESLVWVEGCNQHFLRWTVNVGTVAADSCHELAVDDCPDYRHHWYDHFYCNRGCPAPQTRTGANG
jgi:hypothetical protein